MVGKKQAISLRLSVTDLRKIKQIAERLGTRDSDLIRFAIRMLLARLSPLSDPSIRGKHLMPFFLEMGPDLTHDFDLDATRLDDILNHGAAEHERVSMEDLHMLALQGEVPTVKASARATGADGPAHPSSGAGTDSEPIPAVERRANVVRRYLFDKYLNWTSPRGAGAPAISED